MDGKHVHVGSIPFQDIRQLILFKIAESTEDSSLTPFGNCIPPVLLYTNRNKNSGNSGRMRSLPVSIEM